MCRYSDTNYRTHFVCMACRHAAKFPRRLETAPRCPSCQAPMLDLGRDFAAPRKNSNAQWRKLEILVAAGVRSGAAERSPLFDSCGCAGPGPRPRTLGEARHPIMGPSRTRFNRSGVA